MNEEKKNSKKERQNPNIVYALADYKQLVMQYKTRHTELVRAIVFWRTTALWVTAIAATGLIFNIVMYHDNKKEETAHSDSLSVMSRRIESLADRFENREQELKSARDELETKNDRISQLEKNLSTVSKKQAEKLLKDVEAK
jgi:hypothetical protein